MKKASVAGTEAFRNNSLTMSYFHTGIRTIIGAEAFHCPVRDGKEWDHLAMVIRHKGLPSWFWGQDGEFIEFGIRGVLTASTWHISLIFRSKL